MAVMNDPILAAIDSSLQAQQAVQAATTTDKDRWSAIYALFAKVKARQEAQVPAGDPEHRLEQLFSLRPDGPALLARIRASWAADQAYVAPAAFVGPPGAILPPTVAEVAHATDVIRRAHGAAAPRVATHTDRQATIDSMLDVDRWPHLR
jgi:hypothetical protein